MKRTSFFPFIFLVSLLLAGGCNSNSNSPQSESSLSDTTNGKDIKTTSLTDFGTQYARAWGSQKPDSVAAFFSEDGSLTVNKGKPAVGRAAIANVAEGFMSAFPDMVVTMDSLPATSNGLAFHWTLTGTNTGPNGTGKKVKIAGIEIWQLDDKGLIKNSEGSFNADEYNRQVKYGVDNH